jgi:hypothetical protein
MRIPIVLLLLCTGVAVYFLRPNRRESGERHPRRRPARGSAGEGGLNRVLAAQLARRTSLSADSIVAVLEGAEDAGIRREIDALLEDVSVVFSRRSAGEPHQAHVRIAYTDGSTTAVDYAAPWDQLPDEVRAEVLRSGKAECVRSWVAPWHSKVA